MDRCEAVERVMRLIDTIESDPMPVPIREVWVFGELALGLDPVDRIDVYLAKDMLFTMDTDGGSQAPVPDIPGIGETVAAAWAAQYPEYVRTNKSGYAAPERCLAAHLVDPDEPIHLEICNASFEDNVRQRVRGAATHETFEDILDPRGVCLWLEGTRSETAPATLKRGEYVFPTLPEALTMIGLNEQLADRASDVVLQWRADRSGMSVRGDVL